MNPAAPVTRARTIGYLLDGELQTTATEVGVPVGAPTSMSAHAIA
jgi:hypothetical protein